ncbi:MAG: hypothetical protein WBN72_03150, partial [Nitrososphaeraceae archaeon]
NKWSSCHKRKRSSCRHNYQNRHIEKWVLVKILLKYEMSLLSGFIDEAKNCITKELEKWISFLK